MRAARGLLCPCAPHSEQPPPLQVAVRLPDLIQSRAHCSETIRQVVGLSPRCGCSGCSGFVLCERTFQRHVGSCDLPTQLAHCLSTLPEPRAYTAQPCLEGLYNM